MAARRPGQSADPPRQFRLAPGRPDQERPRACARLAVGHLPRRVAGRRTVVVLVVWPLRRRRGLVMEPVRRAARDGRPLAHGAVRPAGGRRDRADNRASTATADGGRTTRPSRRCRGRGGPPWLTARASLSPSAPFERTRGHLVGLVRVHLGRLPHPCGHRLRIDVADARRAFAEDVVARRRGHRRFRAPRSSGSCSSGWIRPSTPSRPAPTRTATRAADAGHRRPTSWSRSGARPSCSTIRAGATVRALPGRVARRNLADEVERVPPLAGQELLGAAPEGAERRGDLVGAQRPGGQGPVRRPDAPGLSAGRARWPGRHRDRPRRPGAGRSCTSRRPGWRVVSDLNIPFPPVGRHAGAAHAGRRRLARRLSGLRERPRRRRLGPDQGAGSGRAARALRARTGCSRSTARWARRRRPSPGMLASADRPGDAGAPVRSAGSPRLRDRGAVALGRRPRQRLAHPAVALGRAVPYWRPAAASPRGSCTATPTRCCSRPRGRSS